VVSEDEAVDELYNPLSPVLVVHLRLLQLCEMAHLDPRVVLIECSVAVHFNSHNLSCLVVNAFEDLPKGASVQLCLDLISKRYMVSSHHPVEALARVEFAARPEGDRHRFALLLRMLCTNEVDLLIAEYFFLFLLREQVGKVVIFEHVGCAAGRVGADDHCLRRTLRFLERGAAVAVLRPSVIRLFLLLETNTSSTPFLQRGGDRRMDL